MSISFRKWIISTAMAAAMPMVGCSDQKPDASNPLVTDVEHSVVKRQSIGNCWLYAQATWLESQILINTDQEVDVSESYWTWWHWYDQMVNSSITELSTGGWWSTSANIILRHGFVTEGEFLSSETGVEMSAAQASAMNAINAALQPGGALGTTALRTPARVRQTLDQAFGSNMASSEGLARSAASTIAMKDRFGNAISLQKALAGNANQRWTVAYYPRIYGETATPSASTQASRNALMKRALRALNDRQPVVMSLMIDFNALDITDATFKKSLVDEVGVGRQGGHMVVLEDYSVTNVPGVGSIGFGDVSDVLKAKALTGKVEMLRAKNSWGKNRPDRGLIDGYTNFDLAYLTGQLAWKNSHDSDADDVSYYTTLTDFVLPPGY